MNIVENGATHNPGETGLALNGEVGTRWTSREPMSPTMAFWVVLDAPAMVSEVHAWSTTWPDDNPRKWVVALMDDTGGHGRKEVGSGVGEVHVVLEPAVRGQVVRIEQLGQSDEFWWSIEHLTLVGTTIEATPEPPPVVPPPVEPPPIEPPVIFPDPDGYSEAMARAQVERWARKFAEWGVYVDEWRLPNGDLYRSTTHVTYPMVRRVQLQDGTVILEPWPWQR